MNFIIENYQAVIALVVLIVGIIMLNKLTKRIKEQNASIKILNYDARTQQTEAHKTTVALGNSRNRVKELEKDLLNASKDKPTPRMRPANRSVRQDGEINFVDSRTGELVTDSTVKVTITDGRLSKCYFATTVNKKYTKVPVILKVLK